MDPLQRGPLPCFEIGEAAAEYPGVGDGAFTGLPKLQKSAMFKPVALASWYDYAEKHVRLI
ncbi:hypothetical protein D3C71_513610 [compost metagenome]